MKRIIKREVLPIPYSETKEWVIKKHYAHRLPCITHSYGLFINDVLEGVVTYGISPSVHLASSICGEQYKRDVLELNRLVINSGVPKNSASFFIAHSLKLLPKKRWIIVSFADSNKGHVGYVYQSTSFIYTGLSYESEGFKDSDGNDYHFRTFAHERDNVDLSQIDKKYHVKMRTNLDMINVVEVCSYLKEYKIKSGLTSKEIDKIMGYKNCAGHWFRTDAGKSLPSVDSWLKLKELLGFDDKYDGLLLKYKICYDRKQHIKDLKLSKIKLLPKHRYIKFIGNKREKRELKSKLLLEEMPYPKGKTERYESKDITEKQTKLRWK